MMMSKKDTIDSIEESDFDSMEYCPVPEGDTWRIDILGELLDSRSSITEIPGFTQEEIQDLIDFVCVSQSTEVDSYPAVNCYVFTSALIL